MKSKLLIASLSLLATSAYAQPSIPAGASPPSNRPDVSREAPSMPHQSGPQPSRPEPSKSMGSPQPAVGATGGTGGNGGLLVGNGGTGGNGGNSSRPSRASVASELVVDKIHQPQLSDMIAKAPKPEKAAEGPTSVGATGVSTPMPPMPGNDAKGPTSVGATGVTTPLPRGVGPTPLKNDDVGVPNAWVPRVPPTPTLLVKTEAQANATAKAQNGAAQKAGAPAGGVTTPIPPLPANNAKAPTSVGSTQSEALAMADTKTDGGEINADALHGTSKAAMAAKTAQQLACQSMDIATGHCM